ncbi:MAG: DNA polymerase/3'-5' exonuclease PolX [Polyangiaceae bacterium]|nr:DNA polymerase/3'-5' exonuclease PolX [Polyangiaceae bacterium]
MDNADVAALFEEVADLLDITGANPFRIRAYRSAARTIAALGEPISQIAGRGLEALTELPGISDDLAHKILEILSTGDLGLRNELARSVPPTLVELMQIPGVGPKRAKLFYDRLGIRTAAELEAAAKKGRLHALPRIGEALEARILEGCRARKASTGRYRLAEADAHAAPILEHLRRDPAVLAADVAGSLRRRKDTVGDLDILVSSESGQAVIERFVRFPSVASVLSQGPTRCSVALRSGLRVDLRAVPPESYGAALHYFTGSKAHNIAVRTIALDRGLKINEYGIFRGDRRIGGAAEEDIFKAVGLSWIPPELRENQGEIDAARKKKLPALVELKDIRGDLHMHTDSTDGESSLAEMVKACEARGYSYMAVTDHSKALRVAGGLDKAGLRAQMAKIRVLRRKSPGITILHGVEVDILDDGRLDLDDAVLGELDLVIAAVHTKLRMPEAQMTERVIAALRNPRVNILAHPTGRLIPSREPSALDLMQVMRAARDLGVMLEINGQPERLDLNDVAIRMAANIGVKLVISSDAHRVEELDYVRHGVDQARRGWCMANLIANTWRLPALRAFLGHRTKATRGAAAHAPL